MPTNRLVPVLTSAAGNCLTVNNWQQADMTIVAFYLDALLMKPGLPFLQSLPDLRAYYPWSGEWVLNASRLKENKEGLYRLRSHYDGEIIQLDALSIFSLITVLKPNYVVLSDSLASQCHSANLQWPSSIQILSEQTGTYSYQTGFAEFCREGLSEKSGLIESDSPADEAMNGRVYDKDQIITILDNQYSQQFTILSAECRCPVCREGYTRAYFHHLLQHTPLLCQRLLIQHNVHYCQNHLLNSR